MSTRATRRWKAETLNFSKMLARAHFGARARQKFLATKKSRFSRIFTFLARGNENWRAEVRAGARALEFSKSMDFQLSNAVSETFPRPLVIFSFQFEIPHENRKKSYRKCPGVLQCFSLHWKKIMVIGLIDQKILTQTGGGHICPPPCRLFRLDVW